MNTCLIRGFCLFMCFLVVYPSYSQFYICDYSDNYLREKSNPAFSHTYKIDGYWRQTYIYYEMIDKVQFNNRIEIVNKSYDNVWSLYSIQLHIDNKDTLILATSDSNICDLVLDSIPNQIKLTIFGRTSKVQVPINEKEIPAKIIILWGYNDSHGILTIRSKKELDEKTIRYIQREVSEGRSPCHHDEYFFFHFRNVE